MSKLELNSGNQFNGMEREDFLALLRSMGIKYEDGHGELIYEELSDFSISQSLCVPFGLELNQIYLGNELLLFAA